MLRQYILQQRIRLRFILRQLGNDGWRRRNDLTQHSSHQPVAALHRAGPQPGRTLGQENRHGQQTAALVFARIIHANEARTYPLPGGKGTVDLFLDGVAVKVALEKIDARPGAEIPIHTHDGSDELLYILQGRGEMTVGEKTLVVSAGDAIHIPQYTPHGLKVSEHVIAVQVYAPRGPEQRFKTTH